MAGDVRRLVMLGAMLMAAVGSAVPAVAKAKTPPPPAPVNLQASAFRFCAAAAQTCLPQQDDNFTTTVPVGTKVTWTYKDTECDVVVPCPGHNVVFAKGGGSTKLVKADGALIFTMVLKKVGTFSYFCTAHQSFGMTGTLVVKKR
jgi:hypothetical protein